MSYRDPCAESDYEELPGELDDELDYGELPGEFDGEFVEEFDGEVAGTDADTEEVPDIVFPVLRRHDCMGMHERPISPNDPELICYCDYGVGGDVEGREDRERFDFLYDSESDSEEDDVSEEAADEEDASSADEEADESAIEPDGESDDEFDEFN